MDDNKSNEDLKSGLDKIIEQNNLSREIENSSQLSSKLSATLLNDQNNLSLEQTQVLGDLISTLQGNKLKDAEERKEANKLAEETLEALEGISQNTKDDNKIIDLDPFGALAGIAAALALAPIQFAKGLASGLASSLKIYGTAVAKIALAVPVAIAKLVSKTFRLDAAFAIIAKDLKTIFKAIGSDFKALGKSFSALASDTFKPLTSFLKSASKAFLAGFAGLQVFRKSTGQFGKLGFFGNAGKVLGNFVNHIKSLKTFVLGDLPKIGSSIDKIFSMLTKLPILSQLSSTGGFISKAFSTFKVVLSTIFDFSKAMGSLFAKLFIPLKIAMDLFYTVTGAIDAFKTQEGGMGSKLLAGLIGGITGLATSIIGMPLDLLKSAAAWLLSKFGMEDLANTLKGFSFTDIISKFGSRLNDVMQNLPDIFMSLVSSMKDKILESFSKLKDNLANVGKFYKAMFLGGFEALKNIIPGGPSPAEAFTAKFNEVMSGGGGNADTTVKAIDNNAGEEISSISTENEVSRSRGNPMGTAPVTIVNKGGDTNVQNSSSTSVRSQGRMRRGFNNDSGAAYR